MNERLLAIFAADLQGKPTEDLLAIAGDGNHETYSEEYVCAAERELDRRGIALPVAAIAPDQPATPVRYGSAPQRRAQVFWWFVLALILLILIVTFAHDFVPR